MSGNASYAILTRVRAQYGARLRESDYLEMAACKSVPEAAAFLRERTAYGPFLAWGDSVPTRGLLEYQLRKALLERSVALCSFGTAAAADLRDYVLLRNSVNELINFLRFLAAGQPERYVLSSLLLPQTVSKFSLQGLSQVKSREDLIECLRGTYFEKILTPVLSTGGGVDLPLAEAILDRSVYEYTENLFSSHGEAEALKEILLLKAELGDAELLYRAKTYYGMSPALLRAMLSGFRLHLSGGELEEMLNAPSGEDVLRIFLAGRYGKEVQKKDLDTVGNWSDRFLPDLLRKRIHFSAVPSVVLFAYLNWLELEVKNLIYVIEGVRYRLPPEQIRALLLLPGMERG
ncbi:MAG: V-type ATPase subunit [Oscillospiraceae bacterium]|nr:V-type ATPase subunit [Oscillospiraceae bacterium]